MDAFKDVKYGSMRRKESAKNLEARSGSPTPTSPAKSVVKAARYFVVKKALLSGITSQDSSSASYAHFGFFSHVSASCEQISSWTSHSWVQAQYSSASKQS